MLHMLGIFFSLSIFNFIISFIYLLFFRITRLLYFICTTLGNSCRVFFIFVTVPNLVFHGLLFIDNILFSLKSVSPNNHAIDYNFRTRFTQTHFFCYAHSSKISRITYRFRRFGQRFRSSPHPPETLTPYHSHINQPLLPTLVNRYRCFSVRSLLGKLLNAP